MNDACYVDFDVVVPGGAGGGRIASGSVQRRGPGPRHGPARRHPRRLLRQEQPAPQRQDDRGPHRQGLPQPGRRGSKWKREVLVDDLDQMAEVCAGAGCSLSKLLV